MYRTSQVLYQTGLLFYWKIIKYNYTLKSMNYIVALQVLLYNGQLDIIVGAPLTENYLEQLQWGGRDDYLNSEKKVWMMNSVPVGYIRQTGKFQQV